MGSMTETSSTKAAFAPARPSAYSTSYSAASEVFPSYSRTRVFNHDLTSDHLKPLLEDCPAPGRMLRRTGGVAFFGAYALLAISFLTALVMEWLHMAGDGPTYEEMDTGAQVLGLVTLAAAAAWLTGAALDFVARRKWVAALLSAWKLHDGHIVRVRDLPVERQRYVSGLGERLDGALEALDANDPAAVQLDAAARTAIVRYFELPVVSDTARRIAQSTVTDPTVQNVRDGYEAAMDAEKSSLLEAQSAVCTIEAFVQAAKVAAAKREIITLAQTITHASTGSRS